MRQQAKGFVVGVVLTTLLFAGSITAFAVTQSISVTYDNIKISIDGTVIQPKDATGKAVEPFISEGTTYLPVRAVAEALGKEVGWDQKTKTVYVGKQPEVVAPAVVYYTANPTVPDLGAFMGIKSAKEEVTNGVNVYRYNANDIVEEKAVSYVELLAAEGFELVVEEDPNADENSVTLVKGDVVLYIVQDDEFCTVAVGPDVVK